MLLKAWRGEERFWKVWWLLGVPLHVLWWTVWFDLWVSGLAPETFLLMTVWFYPGMLLVLAGFAALFLGWCTLAWRCAGNVDRALWTTLGRVLIGATLGSFLTECLLIVGAPLA
jgi:hypothetical protein